MCGYFTIALLLQGLMNCAFSNGCNERLFEPLWPFNYLKLIWPLSSDLWLQQGIFFNITAIQWIFSHF